MKHLIILTLFMLAFTGRNSGQCITHTYPDGQCGQTVEFYNCYGDSGAIVISWDILGSIGWGPYTGNPIQLAFSAPGSYVVYSAVMMDDTFFVMYDTVSILMPVVASFIVSPDTTGCTPLISYIDFSGTIHQSGWKLYLISPNGDTTIADASTLQFQPPPYQMVFQDTGCYSMTMIAYGFDCNDTLYKPNYICVENCTGMSKVKPDQIYLFPNPSDGQLKVDDTSMRVFSMEGLECVATGPTFSLSNGLYVIWINGTRQILSVVR